MSIQDAISALNDLGIFAVIGIIAGLRVARAVWSRFAH